MAFLLIFVLAPMAGQSQSLGTLFTTPEERAYLDYLREDFLARTAEAGFNIDENAVPEIPEDENQVVDVVQFHLDGIMTLNDGRRTVWLNGSPIFERDLPANARIVSADGVSALRLSTADNAYIIKPGQTVDITTSEIWDAFDLRPSSQNTEVEEVVEELQNDTQAQIVEGAGAENLTTMQLIDSIRFSRGEQGED